MSLWKTKMSPLVNSQVLQEKKENRSSVTDRSLSKFQVYENSVSDAWETEVLANDKTSTFSVKVFIASKVEENIEEVIMPPVSAPNHRNSRVQALQRLAIQKEPLPSLSVTTPSSSKATLNTLPEVSGITPRLTFRHPTTGPSTDQNRFARLRKLFTCEISSKTTHATGDVDLERLREDCWMGIPHRLRPYAWRILSGYIPTGAANKQTTINQKRGNYWEFVAEHYPKRLEEEHSQTFRQIHIDIPRMCPLIPLFQQDVVQEIFERILFIWAIQHPEIGYVQGINDLVTPFFVVYLSEFIPTDVELGSFQVSQLPLEQLQFIEADCFWCVRSLLHSIQDNYIFEQPGIQRKVKELENLTSRVDKTLHDHLISNGIEFLQFSFRWMNNILMREIPLRATIRLWDTYLCEPDGFSQFHNYVCSAFLRKWSRQIQTEKDFQGIIIFLQNLPTQSWGDQEICELTADAYSLMSVFDGARRHFQTPKPCL